MGFQRILGELHAESFRIELWGAAEVIEQCSEDWFFGFRGWLVAQGRRVYEAAVADPDSLADVAELRPDRPEFERLPYGEALWGVAVHTYEAGTSANLLEVTGWPGELVGSWWPYERHEVELQRRYPRLWARFRASGSLATEQAR